MHRNIHCPSMIFITGIGLETGAIEPAEGVLEKEGSSDGGDERDETRGLPQRPIGHPFEKDGDQGGRRHRNDEDDDQADDGMSIQESGRIQSGGKEVRRIRPAHEDFAVGEVDHPEDPIDHGVAHGDQGIDAPLGQTEDDEIKPVTAV